MRIQLASDLHLEFDRPRSPARIIEPAPGADVLVLAGDIHNGANAVEVFADWPVPVVLVAGNHEFYGRDWQRTRDELRRAAAGTCVQFLDNDAFFLDGVRFLGATLWTDFNLNGVPQAVAMAEVGIGLNDYVAIRHQGEPLRPTDTLADHLVARNWLASELAKPWPGTTVVVTHHAPHPLSVHPRFAQSRINPGFTSDLTELVRQADMWLHGHVHDSFDYEVEGCRVMANPAGYMRTNQGLENRQFDPQLVIEVDA